MGSVFGEGAVAGVGGPSEGAEPTGIGPVVWGSAGDQGNKITVTGRTGSMRQDGQAVFRWATTAMAPGALEACRRGRVTPADLQAFLPHPADLPVGQALARRLGVPPVRGPAHTLRPAH